MTPEDNQQLIDDHFMFKNDDRWERNMITGVLGADQWGVFMSSIPIDDQFGFCTIFWIHSIYYNSLINDIRPVRQSVFEISARIAAVQTEDIPKALYLEMTKITNSNQSHKSYRKYKSENGRTRTSEYIRGGIRCHRSENQVSFGYPIDAPYFIFFIYRDS
jgi:hypothetical protein